MNATLGHIPKKSENICLDKTCIHIFIAALFIMPKNGNNPDFHKLVDVWLKCGIIIQWNITVIKRNKVQTHSITWISLENTIFKCKWQSQKNTNHMVQFIRNI